MRFDQLGLLITNEQAPGCYGDSCAESSRLQVLIGPTVTDSAHFRTAAGYLRHPLSPWREDDFSGDQALPFLLACELYKPEILSEARTRLHWNTGSHISSLGVMAASWQAWRLLNLINCLQGLLFKVPFRWSDEHHSFERSQSSSADYLNYFIVYYFLKRTGRWATLNVPTQEVVAKVRSYYRNQVNSDWLVAHYEKAAS